MVSPEEEMVSVTLYSDDTQTIMAEVPIAYEDEYISKNYRKLIRY